MAYCSLIPYFCPQIVTDPDLVGPGTDYPWGYTYEEMIFALYRVKNVELNVELTAKNVVEWEDAQNVPHKEEYIYSYGLQVMLPKSQALNEEALACYGRDFNVRLPLGSHYGNATYIRDSDPPIVTSLELRGSGSGGFYLQLEFYNSRFFSGKFYPRFLPWIFGSAGAGPWFSVAVTPGFPNGHSIVFGFSSTNNHSTNDRMKIYRPIFNDQPLSLLNTSAVDFQDLSLSIRYLPDDYWPYDPGDTAPYPGKDGSGPVYDSITGAQLRNPFNIVKRGDGTFYNPNYVAP